jgi:hypothetical protein
MWMGSDHILLVKSAWFREEYKRFYLRDIQAIVVAPGARFHVSTPMLILALAWLLPGFGIAFWPSYVVIGWGIGIVAMAAVWLTLSIAGSCRCRLYTAVSKDDLPSLYRTWTARRFLRKVQPRIEEVQGAVDAGWAEAERSSAGPIPAAMAPAAPRPSTTARSHTLAADLFVLSLFLGSLVSFATVHSTATATAWSRVNGGLALLQLAGAVAVLVQYSRGSLGRPMQRVAIAALVVLGLNFYVQTFVFSFATAMRATPGSDVEGAFMVFHRYRDGVGLLLGAIGAVIILRGRFDPDIIKD